ncbi:DNA-3-methyladenine glycosylase [Nitrosomonas sp. Nm34]|uniref:DNA-3-methyladenine glycosylase family protein n=1 Tax=Nitrosomonas sp. Nm34 TaxID=1881055 RepID=UPI0008E2EFF0|nr:AlkA N-terminal domain-containing protein [Nitrosomonas sp. Nm34]SFI92263.1 AraC family transcriptional regulator, regulatory protein of adaptative response / DNA-3-methyladenine glycosylase II [Nitrosomonas sp. Nm34]
MSCISSQQEEKTTILHLGYHPPLAWNALVIFLCSRGSRYVEQLMGNRYLRTIKLGNDAGWIAAQQDPIRSRIDVEISPSLLPHLAQLQTRLHILFDLDANPVLIENHLKHDKTLKPLIIHTPGLRVPGTLNAFELSLRAIVGQQVSVKAATTLFNRFVTAFGEPVDTPFPELNRTVPVVSAIADAKLPILINLGVTQRRALTIQLLARQIADGTLKLEEGNSPQLIEQLMALPGIGPWTAQYIAMRALGDSNAIPASDLGLMHALQVKKSAGVISRTEKWQPWRAYGVIHLWHYLSTGG